MLKDRTREIYENDLNCVKIKLQFQKLVFMLLQRVKGLHYFLQNIIAQFGQIFPWKETKENLL